MRQPYTLDGWRESGGATRRRVAAALYERLDDDLVPDGVAETDLELPAVRHLPTDTRWIAVPGGTYWMGLGPAEVTAARLIAPNPPLDVERCGPVHRVAVGPFWCLESPLVGEVASDLADGEVWQLSHDDEEEPDQPPALVLFEDAVRIADGFDAALPSEEQWEWACRGGTTSLFWWGDALPDAETLHDTLTADVTAAAPNPFGLRGLFTGEWCRDAWRPRYGAPPDPSSHAVRGGGSTLWPWQGRGEWVGCVSAARTCELDWPDQYLGVRLVWPI